MTLHLVDRGRPTVSAGRKISASRSLTTLVWYPAVGGPWPVVVFAHGFEVGPQPYQHLLQTWAAAGYVVVAPEFPLTDAAVAGPDLDEGDLGQQPADVAVVLASVLDPSGPLAGHVDGTRVGVAGHSDGAETALAVAADPPVALGAVVVLAGSPVSPGPASGSPLRGPLGPCTPLRGPLGPGTPLLVAQGDADPTNAFSDGRAVYDQATAPRFLLTLVGGGHLSPFTGGSRYEDVVDKTTLDFLDAYLARTGPSSAISGDGAAGLARIATDS
ncbi:MAG: alpha/beta hydrolase family protein [Acidimicrobiales bacterium]